MIITISKSLLLENWNIQIYFSKTSRKFQAYIQKDDFMSLRISQLRQIIPFVFTEIFKRQQQYIDYKDFDSKYLNFKKFMDANKQHSNNNMRSKMKLKTRLQAIIEKFYQKISKEKREKIVKTVEQQPT